MKHKYVCKTSIELNFFQKRLFEFSPHFWKNKRIFFAELNEGNHPFLAQVFLKFMWKEMLLRSRVAYDPDPTFLKLYPGPKIFKTSFFSSSCVTHKIVIILALKNILLLNTGDACDRGQLFLLVDDCQK